MLRLRLAPVLFALPLAAAPLLQPGETSADASSPVAGEAHPTSSPEPAPFVRSEPSLLPEPPADSKLVIAGGSTLRNVVEQIGELTGVLFRADSETWSLLNGLPCGLDRPAEIAGPNAWRFLNDLLLSNQLYIGALRMSEPYLLEICPSQSQEAQRVARSFPLSLTPEQLEAFGDYTAFMVQVPFQVKYVEAHQVTHYMRDLSTDPNVSHIISTGVSAVLATGPVRIVNSVGAIARAADDAERIRREVRATESR